MTEQAGLGSSRAAVFLLPVPSFPGCHKAGEQLRTVKFSPPL